MSNVSGKITDERKNCPLVTIQIIKEHQQYKANLQRCCLAWRHFPHHLAEDKGAEVTVEKFQQDSLVLKPGGELPLLLQVGRVEGGEEREVTVGVSGKLGEV